MRRLGVRGWAGLGGLLALLAAGPVPGQEDEGWGLDLVAGEVEPGWGQAGGALALEEPPAAAPSAAPVEPAARRTPRTPACLRREPSSAELVRAAVEVAGLGAGEDRERAWRVRVAGFLPKLTAGVDMDVGDRQDFRYEPGSPRVDQLQVDDGWGWDVGLSLDLSGAAYRADELQVAREAVRRARERRELALEVIRLQHARLRLLRGGLPTAGSDEGAQLAELGALLDAWTGGRFADRLCRPRAGR